MKMSCNILNIFKTKRASRFVMQSIKLICYLFYCSPDSSSGKESKRAVSNLTHQ